RMYRGLIKQIRPINNTPRRLSRSWIPYAAAAILAVAGVWYITDDESKDLKTVQVTAADIVPAGNRAMLTLPDGHSIALSEDHMGIAVNDALTYLDGTIIVDDELMEHTEQANKPLALTTPSGSTYQITLPDGTIVRLN